MRHPLIDEPPSPYADIMDSVNNSIAEAGKHFSTRPAGHLLGKVGLVAIGICFILAAWYNQFAIAILLGLVLAAAGLSRLWSRLSLSRVSCQRFLSEHRAFPGEQIELKLQMENRKLLPLPWAQIDDEIPTGLVPDSTLVTGSRPGFGYLSKTASLLWYTRINWRQRLYCHKRGYYRLGPITITSGDIFGFYPRSTINDSPDSIIVYPRIFPITQLGIASLHPLGDNASERRIFEDPTRTVGIRDYSPFDSLKRIHWKASARHQSLKSKLYEPTTTLKVAIFLVIDSFPHNNQRDEDDFELGISVAASIGNYLIKQGSLVGLFANTLQADSGQPIVIPPGSSNGQLVTILEALAKVTLFTSVPFEKFLQSEGKALHWGTTPIIILSRPSESLSILLTDLKEHGNKPLFLQVGEQSADSYDSGWHNLRKAGEIVKTGVPTASEVSK